MRTRILRVALLAALVGRAAPACADATIFAGTSTPATRPVRGVAMGAGLLVIGFEFEYAYTAEDTTVSVPELKTGTGSVLIQTPGDLLGVQPYFITGAGLYRETLGGASDNGVTFNTGVGVKILMFGPIRFRLDYRVIKLRSGASPTRRLYAGLNLKF